jgi:hypothetical protein
MKIESNIIYLSILQCYRNPQQQFCTSIKQQNKRKSKECAIKNENIITYKQRLPFIMFTVALYYILQN